MEKITRSQTRRLTAGFGALLVSMLALSACAGDPEVIQPTDDPTTVQPTVVVEKSAPPEVVLPPTWPLTGIEGEIVARPALSVKIENSSQARPQTGIEMADVVWEQLIEGGETRFNVVFHSQLPAEVGPIRSVRPMDAGIAAPLGGLIAFSGGQAQFVDSVRASGLQIFSNDLGADGMYRTSNRRAPHNVYGDPAVFLSQADATRAVPPPQQFVFAPTAAEASAVVAGSPATSLVPSFPASKPSWTWDAGTGKWLRFERGAPAMVASGAQIGSTNVVMIKVDITDTGTKDPIGTTVYETVMVGSGEAIVATGGQIITGTWSKTATDAPMVLTGLDGTPITLAPGNTWVEMVPNAGGSIAVS